MRVFSLRSRRLETSDSIAVNATDRARTIATSSSSLVCASCAPSSSSLAITNDTDTDRSLPMALSAPTVVPAIDPPVSALMPADASATKSRERKAAKEVDNNSAPPSFRRAEEVCRSLVYTMTTREIEVASNERICVCGDVVSWQAKRLANETALPGKHALMVRRLVVAPAPGRACGKRKERDRVHGQKADVAGAVFGCTLGNVHSFCFREGTTTTAYILREARAVLQPAVEALGTSSGRDKPYLVLSMASSHVVRVQKMLLPELTSMKLHSKYGNAGTGIGATAAVLVCYWVLVRVPSSSNREILHVQAFNSLACRFEKLRSWLSAWPYATVSMPADQDEALRAEFRCAERAYFGCKAAEEESGFLKENAFQCFQRQLVYARQAAWPERRLLDETEHARILQEIQDGVFFSKGPALRPQPAAPAAVDLCNLPFSALSELKESRGSSSSSVSASTFTGSSRSGGSARSALSGFSDTASVAEEPEGLSHMVSSVLSSF